MAPAPPGNKSSDWLAPPRPPTSLPRVPPLSGAPAQNPAGGPKSAESLRLGGGAELRAVRKPAKRPFRLGALVPEEEEEVLPFGLRLLFLASIRVPLSFSARLSAPPL